MNRDRLKLWTDALLSDEFEQGQGYLNLNGRLCCLGVLCEVAIRDGLEVRREEAIHGKIEYDGQACYPPDAVLKWLGWSATSDIKLSADTPAGGGRYEFGVAHLNDSMGWTFQQIAEGLTAKYGAKEVDAA